MSTRVEDLRSEIADKKKAIAAAIRAKRSDAILATLYIQLDNLQLDLQDEVYYAAAA